MERKCRNTKSRNRLSIMFPILAIIGFVVITVFLTNRQQDGTSNWSGVRAEIKDSMELARLRGITSGYGGMGVSTVGEVNRRRWIMRNATESELLKLIEYPNGTVKAIAYEGLLRKKQFSNKTELTLKAIKDTTYLVYYQSGCVSWKREIAEYLVQDVLMMDDQVPPLPPEMYAKFDLTEINKEKILSEYKKRPKREY